MEPWNCFQQACLCYLSFSLDFSVTPGILEGHRVFKHQDSVTSEGPRFPNLHFVDSLFCRAKSSNIVPGSWSLKHGSTISISMLQDFNVNNTKGCHGQNQKFKKKITKNDSKAFQIMKISYWLRYITLPRLQRKICIRDLYSKASSYKKVISHEVLRSWTNSPL